MSFCLPKILNRKLQQALDSGRVTSDSLIKMSSSERKEFFKRELGEQYAEEANKRFVNKFNTNLTDEQLDVVLKKTSKIDEMRTAYNASPDKIKTLDDYRTKDAPEWAKEYVNLTEEITDIINPRNKMGILDSTTDFLKEKVNIVKNTEGALPKVGQTAVQIADVITTPALKPLKAAMDASYLLRQGFKVLATDRKAYSKAVVDSFQALKNVLSSKDKAEAVMREFKAKALAHPYYDELVVKGKLSVNAAEETFPTTVGEKIPALGGIFRASNNAFTIFSQSARLELASDVYEKLLLNRGVENITPEMLKDIGSVVNSITGRGSLGKAEAISEGLNRIFFAPRYVRSSIDTFALPFNTALTPEARQLALKSSRNTLAGIAGILGVASAFGDVELDPFSNNFGTMVIPGTNAKRVDLTAGHGQYVRLFAQSLAGKRTDAKGKTIEFGDSKTFKPDTRAGNIGKFVSNKLAPGPSMVKQLFSDEQFIGGQKVKPDAETVIKASRELFAPIGPNNVVEYLQDESFATALMLFITEGAGFGIKSSR